MLALPGQRRRDERAEALRGHGEAIAYVEPEDAWQIYSCPPGVVNLGLEAE
jgi:hypothetical protein